MVVDAIDNFSNDSLDLEYKCIARFFGVFVAQTDEYLILQYIKADLNMPNSASEFHYIVRSSIVHIKEVEVEMNE